jgi:hypothetical protein
MSAHEVDVSGPGAVATLKRQPAGGSPTPPKLLEYPSAAGGARIVVSPDGAAMRLVPSHPAPPAKKK